MPLLRYGKKNGEIEFFRFIFSVIILLHHSQYLVQPKNCPFVGGSLAVEFFFILSGCLMAQSIEKERCFQKNTIRIGKETLQFMARKLKGLFPQLFFAWFIAFSVTMVASNQSWREMANSLIDGFTELTVIKMSGLTTGGSVNGVVWYISSMLLCMFFLYPLIRKYPDVMYHVVIPLTILLGYGLLCQTYGSPRGGPETYKADVRALAGICTGIVCYWSAIKLREIRLTTFGQAVLSFVKWCCYGASVYYMHTISRDKKDYFFIMLLAIAVIISFSQQSVENNFFQQKWCTTLGSFSLYLYLSHIYWAENLNTLFTQNMDDPHKMLVYFSISTANALILQALTWICKKYGKPIWNNIKQLFLQPAQEMSS